ncbi:helix-turn-helix domain-containing protein [Enterococcus larvae]|uniref:helix-turn-helix domain-containing protein n=1 Tax=Enterococcus larvae TaxID=2794352 RepID=UPI003F342D91
MKISVDLKEISLPIISKEIGIPSTHSADTENPKNRATYFQIKDMLMSGFPIATIKEMAGVTRSTIYRIKKELEQMTVPTPKS